MTKTKALNLLNEKINSCNKCEALSGFRNQNYYLHVPGEGNNNARFMIIGEAPGKNEAEIGRPFVGRAGKMLDKIIEEVGWKRDDLFICNTIKCRPPENRNPLEEEIDNCIS